MKHKKNNSNFKKVLAAAAVTTAVVAVPAVVADADASTPVIDPVGTDVSTPVIDAVGADKKINYTLKLKLAAIPKDKFVQKFEWSYVDDADGTNPILIPNATTSTFEVPIEALGKIIQLRVTTEKDGKVEVLRGTHVVSDIKLVLGEIKLIGDGNEDAFVIGDTITVGAIDLKDETTSTDLLFENGQVKYSYQWYEQLEGSGYNIIPGATGRSYTIPADIDTKNLVAKVTVELNGESYTSLTKPYKLEDGSGIVDALIEEIDLLIDDPNPVAVGQEIYSSLIDLENFIIKVDDLLSSYNKFATNAKAEVTNIDILLEAKKDINIANQYVLSLQQHATKLATIKIDGDLTEKQATELEKLLNVLQAERELLNSLQISLVDKILEENNDLPVYDTLIESVEEKLSNRQYDIVFDTIKKINEDIASKFDPSLDLNATPIKIDELKMKYTSSLEELTTGIKTLNDQINKLPKKYRPFVFTSLIKQMEGDIKKASAAVGKLEKINNASFDKKQTTAMSAFKSYVTLTPLQRSLVDTDLVSEMQTILTDGPKVDTKVTDLVNEIAETLFGSTLDYEAYDTDLTTLESEIKVLTERYKKLSSAEKKLITNYKYLAAASKDLKAALRVQDIFEEAEKLEEAAIGGETSKEKLATTKKAISKYKSAITAHTKLTKLQQTFIPDKSLNESLGTYGTLVQNSKDLESEIKLEKKPELEIEELDYSFNGEIQSLFSSNGLTYTGKLPDFQILVADLLARYKAMNSTEKKGVYSNAQLTKANSDVKKAKSVYEKLLAASEAKDVKKYASALATYKKLTSLQQSLIDIDSIAIPVEGENVDVDNVIKTITNINDSTEILEEVKELEKEYNALSSSDKKLVTNASDLKSILKDVKAVEAFAAKVIKLGSNPKISQKESIVKSYYKLTMAQANLFNTDFEEAKTLLLGFETDIHNKTQAAQDLNTKIYEVLDDTDIETIKSEIADIESDYSVLASADRKLVTNYSKLSTVKRDIDAVEKVKELAEAMEAFEDKESSAYKKAEKDWQRAYNKLNTRQLSLYP